MHVIATAGHVDHGKSTLVRALTGMEPDRWESERRRGMTIDLGFAWTSLPSGGPVAFVDVPGHERFIPNMLAGAGSVPAVMFVVAADEGWMPQSAEHLAAIDAFGVRHGVLAISRSDLADPGSAMREAQRHLSGTSLGSGAAGPEAVAVSALTGRGLPDLVAALDRLVARLPAADPDGDVRLWLDRAFVIKGSGTVVTGTLQAGTIRAGDELTLTPSQRRVRVRGMQSLGTPVTQASGVARVALNLRGVGATDLRRGMALVTEGRWTLTGVIDVRVLPPPSHPAGAAALPARVTLHVGTARVAAGLRVLGERIARLTLAHPLPLHVGDRLLLRDPGARAARAAASGPGGPAMVAAAVLDVTPPPLRGSGAAARAAKDLASWPDAPAISHLLARHPVLRARTAEAMGLRGLPEPVAGDWLVDPAHWRRLRGLLAEAVAADAARDPLAPGLAVDAARARLGLPDRRLVEALAAWEGAGAEPLEASRGCLRRAARAPGRAEAGGPPGGSGLPPAAAAGVRALLAILKDAPFSPPDAASLRELGLDPRATAAAERAGLLLRLPGNVVLGPAATERAAAILARLPQPFTASQARQALRTSRRVAIPLLERLDREGLSERLPDGRRIMRQA